MLAELADEASEVAATFDCAGQVLGYDLWEIVRNGPKESLDATEQTQPAMLAAGVAVWRVWKSRGGPDPDLVAGHSLGEFSALVCASSLTFEDAVKAVAARARFMQQAVPCGEGGIAAIIGLDDDVITGLCETVVTRGAGHVSAVNFNAPGQVVVAGHASAVAQAMAAAREAGARRTIDLPMSVPVHCALMRPAAEHFRHTLAEIEFTAPRIEVVHNADLSSHCDPVRIREALVQQLTSPVRWVANVAALVARGADTLVEPGPGRVLTGLLRRINRDLHAMAIHDPASLQTVLGELG